MEGRRPCHYHRGPMEPSSRAAYVSAIEEWRAQRDLFFSSHYASPLEETDQETFAGLAYFDIDPEQES